MVSRVYLMVGRACNTVFVVMLQVILLLFLMTRCVGVLVLYLLGDAEAMLSFSVQHHSTSVCTTNLTIHTHVHKGSTREILILQATVCLTSAL